MRQQDTAAGQEARLDPEGCSEGPAIYRPRDPRASSLYRLVEKHYDTVKGLWEERFEARYGFWRGFVDGAICRYLDCGIMELGFARVKCKVCPEEFLVGFSCKGRGLCPSCAAKRGASVAAYLREEVLEDVGHAQWVFSLPKMLRPYFMYHRELLGDLCRAAYETVRQLMAALEPEEDDLRPGMVTVVQTFGSKLNLNPHVHALVSRGGWTRSGDWVPVPYVDTHAAELLFRHKVIRLLQGKDLLSQERTELLLSWKHSGFSIHNSVTIAPGDHAGIERIVRYFLRPPVSLPRIRWDEEKEQVSYSTDGNRGHDDREHAAAGSQTLDEVLPATEFLARVITHIPDPKLHVIRYFGSYSAVVRARRRRQHPKSQDDERVSVLMLTDESTPPSSSARRAWAEMIRRVYEVDPLVCKRCGGEMRIISFITDPAVIRKILEHIEKRGPKRGPPLRTEAVPSQ